MPLLHAEADGAARWKAFDVFKKDCLKATPESLPELIQQFSKISEDDSFKGDYFLAVADAWLRQWTPPEDLNLVFKQSADPLPELPSDLPKEYATFIRQYINATTPFRALQKHSRPSKENASSFLAHQKEYWDTVTDILKNHEGPFTDKILQYVWGHWCGTGSDRFYNPHAVALLIALIQDGRWLEAAGGSLFIPSRALPDSTAKILATFFPHPEEVVAGGLAWNALQPTDRVHENMLCDLLTLMVILPGENRVSFLTKLGEHAPKRSLQHYFRALQRFVPYSHQKSSGKMVQWRSAISISGSDRLDTVVAEAVNEKGQTQALEFLCIQASPKLPVEAAKILAKIFLGKQQPSSIPAMRRLLEHPSQSVADKAAEALQVMGESFTMPKKLGPVRYRIVVDGQPHAEKIVGWAIPHAISSSGKTSTEGILEISRDVFFDSENRTQIILYSSREFDMSKPDDPAQSRFEAILPIPRKTDEPQLVRIATQSQKILLDLPRSDTELAGRKMEIRLSGRQEPDFRTHGSRSSSTFLVPSAREWTLPKIQAGKYQVSIFVPGFASWSGDLFVSDGSPMTVHFTKASDMKFFIKPPPDWDVRSIFPELWQNGKRISADWDYEKRFFRGVLPGDYTLHIPSSTESRKKVLGVISARSTFPAVDIPFTVPSDPPVEIALEDIVLASNP